MKRIITNHTKSYVPTGIYRRSLEILCWQISHMNFRISNIFSLPFVNTTDLGNGRIVQLDPIVDLKKLVNCTIIFFSALHIDRAIVL